LALGITNKSERVGEQWDTPETGRVSPATRWVGWSLDPPGTHGGGCCTSFGSYFPTLFCLLVRWFVCLFRDVIVRLRVDSWERKRRVHRSLPVLESS
jgi:hypothetical protein